MTAIILPNASTPSADVAPKRVSPPLIELIGLIILSNSCDAKPASVPILRIPSAVNEFIAPILLIESVAFSVSSACLSAISAALVTPFISAPVANPSGPKFLPQASAADPALLSAVLYFANSPVPFVNALAKLSSA